MVSVWLFFRSRFFRRVSSDSGSRWGFCARRGSLSSQLTSAVSALSPVGGSFAAAAFFLFFFPFSVSVMSCAFRLLDASCASMRVFALFTPGRQIVCSTSPSHGRVPPPVEEQSLESFCSGAAALPYGHFRSLDQFRQRQVRRCVLFPGSEPDRLADLRIPGDPEFPGPDPVRLAEVVGFHFGSLNSVFPCPCISVPIISRLCIVRSARASGFSRVRLGLVCLCGAVVPPPLSHSEPLSTTCVQHPEKHNLLYRVRLCFFLHLRLCFRPRLCSAPFARLRRRLVSYERDHSAPPEFLRREECQPRRHRADQGPRRRGSSASTWNAVHSSSPAATACINMYTTTAAVDWTFKLGPTIFAGRVFGLSFSILSTIDFSLSLCYAVLSL